jgi:hydrogenase maturation protease
MQISGLVELSTRMTERSGAGDRREERRCCGGSCACEEAAPVLLLALGNPLMSDDGAGQELLATLESEAPTWGSRVEFMDGGTQGLALLGKFEGRKAVVFLDAVRLGGRAGAVHLLQGNELARLGGARVATAHEGSAPQILAALQLLGEVPEYVVMVGIEPEQIRTGIGLSAPVKASLSAAAGFARMRINNILAMLE